METKASYVAVGAFVMTVLVGAAIAALWLAGAQYNQRYAHYETHFTGAVTGLGTGTPVRYNGIDVGRVAHLRFDPDDPKQVIVLMEVDPGLSLRADSVASIASMGITGGTFVEIDGGSKDAPLLTARPGEEYPQIPSKPSTLQELANSAPALLAKINRIGDELGELLDEKNRDAVSHILHNTDTVTAGLAQHSGQLGQTIDNLDASSAELNQTLKSLHGTIDNANHAIGSIDKLARDADTLVGPQNAQQLDRLLSETRNAVASLKALADTLQHDPKSLLFGPSNKGYKPK